MNTKHIALLALASFALVTCKKDDEPFPTMPDPSPVPAAANILLNVDLVNGTVPFDLSADLLDGAANTIRLNTLKFYVSGVYLTDDDNVVVASFPDTYILVDAGQPTANNFALGSMNADHIHRLHFTLGLDAATNFADPLLASYPLNIPGMHWSWNPSSGYKFLNLEGYVDVDQNGVYGQGVDVDFQYHCAQNTAQAQSAPVLRQSDIEVHEDVVAGQALTIGVTVDMAMLLQGIDLQASPVAMGNGAGNQLIMDNLVNAINAH